jgi:RNA polymerase sigma-70 factor (ECF subfamily)
LDLPSGETPEDILERQETKDLVEHAITQLPPNFRLPLMLKDLMELSIQEIAEILGIKEATVKTRLHRARLFAADELSKGLPMKPAPSSDRDRAMCLDLLQAKQESLDRGVEFPVAQDELCARCRSLFATLDLTHDACHQLGQGEIPVPLKEAILNKMKELPRRNQHRS